MSGLRKQALMAYAAAAYAGAQGDVAALRAALEAQGFLYTQGPFAGSRRSLTPEFYLLAGVVVAAVDGLIFRLHDGQLEVALTEQEYAPAHDLTALGKSLSEADKPPLSLAGVAAAPLPIAAPGEGR